MFTFCCLYCLRWPEFTNVTLVSSRCTDTPEMPNTPGTSQTFRSSPAAPRRHTSGKVSLPNGWPFHSVLCRETRQPIVKEIREIILTKVRRLWNSRKNAEYDEWVTAPIYPITEKAPPPTGTCDPGRVEGVMPPISSPPVSGHALRSSHGNFDVA